MLWMCFFDYWTYDKLLLNIREIFRYWVLNENLGEGEERWRSNCGLGRLCGPECWWFGGEFWTGFSDLWALWGMSHVHKGRFIASKVVALLVKQTSLWYAITSRCAICYLKRKKISSLRWSFLEWNKSFQGFEDVEMNCKIFIRNVKIVESSLCIETVRQC